jgi:hypothetical protein
MRLDQRIYTLPLRLRSLFRRPRLEQDLDDELRFHLDRAIQEAVSRGEEPQEAHRHARLALHGVELCKEECRDMRRTSTIENLLRDFVYAGRTLRRSPLGARRRNGEIAAGCVVVGNLEV